MTPVILITQLCSETNGTILNSMRMFALDASSMQISSFLLFSPISLKFFASVIPCINSSTSLTIAVSLSSFCFDTSTECRCRKELITKNISSPTRATAPILRSNINSIIVIKQDSSVPPSVSITTRVATSASNSIVLVVILVILPSDVSLKYPMGT